MKELAKKAIKEIDDELQKCRLAKVKLSSDDGMDILGSWLVAGMEAGYKNSQVILKKLHKELYETKETY